MPKLSRKTKKTDDPIVIDEKRGLVFSTEEELFDHFLPQIQALEKEFFESRRQDDISEDKFADYEELLQKVLEEPDEIWIDAETVFGYRVHAYIGYFREDTQPLYYVALTFNTADTPSFIFLHFPTYDAKLVERYRRGTLHFDRVIREVEAGAIEGDALGEGDDLAVGLYKAMLKLRGKGDVSEKKFKDHAELREATIEEADEIWRSTDFSGNNLVTFIKDFSDQKPNLHYLVVTIEDPASSSHALLFSFPTCDPGLIERYRHGESLHADEVVQEASH